MYLRFRSTVLGLTALLSLCGAIALHVLAPSELVVYSGWALFAVLSLLWVALNRATLLTFLTQRSTRYGANLSFVIFLVLGILVFVNVLGKEHHWRKDITRNAENSLSPQTLKILEELKQEVKAFYFSSLQEKEKGEGVLKNYAYQAKNFKYEFVDTARRPTLTQSMGVKQKDTVVFVLGDTNKRMKVEGVTEEKLTNGLIKLLRSKEVAVYFTVGHEEHPLEPESDPMGYGNWKAELEKQGYTVKPLNLLGSGKIPDDAALVIVGAPKATFFPKEIEILGHWIMGGGHALFTVDLDVAESGLTKGSRQLAELLNAYGVNVQSQMLVDPTSRMANVEPQILLGFAAGKDHPITKDFAHSGLVANFLFPLTTYLTFDEKPDFTVTTLAHTSPQAWAESDWASLKRGSVTFDGKDHKGQMDLAYAVEKKQGAKGESAKGAKLVVFADGMFATNSLIDKVGNRDLVLNAVAWLSDEDRFISIRAKEEGDTLKQFNNAALNLIFLFTIFVVPLGLLLLGVSVWWRRSKL